MIMKPEEAKVPSKWISPRFQHEDFDLQRLSALKVNVQN